MTVAVVVVVGCGCCGCGCTCTCTTEGELAEPSLVLLLVVVSLVSLVVVVLVVVVSSACMLWAALLAKEAAAVLEAEVLNSTLAVLAVLVSFVVGKPEAYPLAADIGLVYTVLEFWWSALVAVPGVLRLVVAVVELVNRRFAVSRFVLV